MTKPSSSIFNIFQLNPENQYCADCSIKLVESIWASTTFGAFLCIQCAAAHRRLGPQISRIKSLNLDTWSIEDIQSMKAGNGQVSKRFCPYISHWVELNLKWKILSDDDANRREHYIRAKYVHLTFTKIPSNKENHEEEGTLHDGPGALKAQFLRPCEPVREEMKSQLSTDCPEAPEEQLTDDSDQNQHQSPIKLHCTPRKSWNSSYHTHISNTTSEKSRLPTQPLLHRKSSTSVIFENEEIDVTKQFVNYFIVVGRGPLNSSQNVGSTKTPTELRFTPTIIDAFPEPKSNDPLPSHLAQFAFPEGFSLLSEYQSPVFFSFILTNVSGNKVYASALRFYEELHPLEVIALISDTKMRTASNSSLNNSQHISTTLPKWAQMDHSGKRSMCHSPGPVYCPKCIIIISHHPHYTAHRQFLQQIYRITLSDAPMPVERYIANFCREIPLPPQGKVQVQLTLPDRTIIVSRPPKNDFPLVDFSFRPLFQLLDMTNVLLVFSCIVVELKVVLCSKHLAILTPVAETLLSLLLPFTWQGAYIPVLPVALWDVIDAPVPFLVGTHSDCMMACAGQTPGVIFVDLDHNRVVPAIDEAGNTIPLPKLPEREGHKLRSRLSECANIFDPYAGSINKVDLAFPNDEHLQPIGNFTSVSGHTIPHQNSLSGKSVSDLNIIPDTTSSASVYPTSLYSMGKLIRSRRTSTQISSSGSTSSLSSNGNVTTPRGFSNGSLSRSSFSFSSSSSSDLTSTSLLQSSHGNPTLNYFNSSINAVDAAGGLTQSTFNDFDSFSTIAIRKAFLRLFVSIFKKYALYLNTASGMQRHGMDQLFDSELFLKENHEKFTNDMPSSTPSVPASPSFIRMLVNTQLFEKFISDRVFNRDRTMVSFFDASIAQKLNRSIGSTLSLHSKGRKRHEASFLDDRSDDIRETYVAPPPSNIGLPDDGSVYHYKSFPRLKKHLFGQIRRPRQLVTTDEQQSSHKLVVLHPNILTLNRCTKNSALDWDTTFRIIVRVQARLRMRRERRRYLQIMINVIKIQQWIRAVYKGCAERLCIAEWNKNATIIKKTYRARLFRQQYLRQLASIKLIHRYINFFYIRRRYHRVLHGFSRLQAQLRARRLRNQYLHIRQVVIKCQAYCRGKVSRKITQSWKQTLLEQCRQQIFYLWDSNNESLLHRSTFWLSFRDPDSYLDIGLCRKERDRLQMLPQLSASKVNSELTTKGGKRLRTRIRSTLQKIVPQNKRGSNHAVQSLKKDSGCTGATNHEFTGVSFEREEIYQSLKYHTTTAERRIFYLSFHISDSSKRKKRTLSNLVWTALEDAEKSANLVASLLSPVYPEQNSNLCATQLKQFRLREDLTFTVNAALKCIKSSGTLYSSQTHAIYNVKKKITLVSREDNETIEMLQMQVERLKNLLLESRKEVQEFQYALEVKNKMSIENENK